LEATKFQAEDMKANTTPAKSEVLTAVFLE